MSRTSRHTHTNAHTYADKPNESDRIGHGQGISHTIKQYRMRQTYSDRISLNQAEPERIT